jgi:predicted dehydrogenase
MAHYRVAVIGHTGQGDYGHGLDVVWQSIPEVEIVAVADADPAGLQRAAERLSVKQVFNDYRRMLDQVRPDIVSVAPRWLSEHRDMVVACAEHGAHVYLEKPFCRSPQEADEIVAACERHQVKLAIAFQTRYSPILRSVRRLIEEGAIGRILELRGRGKEDRRGGGEDLWVLGSHVMNLMHYFAGEPKWCFAKITQDQRDLSAEHISAGNEGIGPLGGDCVNAMYGFDDDVTGYVGSHRNAGPGDTGRFGLRLCGSEGQIELLTGHLPPAFLLRDPLWSPGRSGADWLPITSLGAGQEEPLEDGGLAEGNRLACCDLLEAIEHDRQPEANMYEARQTVEMIAAAFASQIAGQPVPLPLQERGLPLARLQAGPK